MEKDNIVIAEEEIISFSEGGLTLVGQEGKPTVYIDCLEAEDGVAEVNIKNLIKVLKILGDK